MQRIWKTEAILCVANDHSPERCPGIRYSDVRAPVRTVEPVRPVSEVAIRTQQDPPVEAVVSARLAMSWLFPLRQRVRLVGPPIVTAVAIA